MKESRLVRPAGRTIGRREEDQQGVVDAEGRPVEGLQPDHVLVERNHPVEVGHPERDPTGVSGHARRDAGRPLRSAAPSTP